MLATDKPMNFDSILLYAVTTSGAIIGYLLKAKDAALEREIQQLWSKHDDDARALQRLEIQVAGEHYKRGELDSRFDRLEEGIRNEMRDLGKKLDALIAAKGNA